MGENHTYQGVRYRRAPVRLRRKTPGGRERWPCMLVVRFSASSAMLCRAAACRLSVCSGTHHCPPSRPGNNTKSAYSGSYSVGLKTTHMVLRRRIIMYATMQKLLLKLEYANCKNRHRSGPKPYIPFRG